MGSGNDSGFVLRHALGEADELWRRCVVNRETAKRAAKAMGLPYGQVKGSVRLLKKFGTLPSRERLATVVMRDYGLDDNDIAEMFGKSPRWAAQVRANIEELRELEPVDSAYEFIDDGLRPEDPCPEEIRRRAEAIRANRPSNYGEFDSSDRSRKALSQPGLRQYIWNGRNAAFISILASPWSRG